MENKNHLFSETIDNNNNNFQTSNMIYKLKKIKKHKKHKKQFSNYKNIDELQNIHDLPSDEILAEGFTSTEECTKYYNNDGNDKRCDYEGIDYATKGDDAEDPRQKIIDYINKIYDSIHQFNYDKALLICQLFSNKEHPEKSDVLLVMNFVSWVESILLSCFVVFNWFFGMFYIDEKGEKVSIPDISRSKLFSLSGEYKALNIFEILFSTAMYFPEAMNWVLFKVFPDFTSMAFNPSFAFILLFFIIIYCIQYLSLSFKNFLVDIILLNTDNQVVNIMYALAIVAWFTYFPYLIGVYISNSDMVGIGTVAATITAAAGSFIISIFVYLLQFIIHLFISVPFGGLFCVIYFIIYSFFGIFIHSGFNPFTTWDNFNKILQFIYKDNEYELKHNIKENMSFVDKCSFVFNQVCVSIYDYIYDITFLILFIISFIHFNKHITTTTTIKNFLGAGQPETVGLLKIVLLTILSSFMILIGVRFYIGFCDIIAKNSVIQKSSIPQNRLKAKKDGFNLIGTLGKLAMSMINIMEKLPNILDKVTEQFEDPNGLANTIMQQGTSALTDMTNDTKGLANNIMQQGKSAMMSDITEGLANKEKSSSGFDLKSGLANNIMEQGKSAMMSEMTKRVGLANNEKSSSRFDLTAGLANKEKSSSRFNFTSGLADNIMERGKSAMMDEMIKRHGAKGF